VLDVTSTGAIIQKVNDLGAEKLNVSLRRLFKSDSQLSEAIPWMGHKITRQIRKLKNHSDKNQLRFSQTQRKPTNVIVTTRE